MRHASEWKLTFDPDGTPLVLVDYGQEIDNELSIALERACELVPLLEADPFIRDEESQSHSFSVKVYTYQTLDKYARRDALNSLISTAALGKKPLKVEVNGIGGYWQYANSWLRTLMPMIDLDADAPCYFKQYNIVAVGFSRTP
ncbi:MAG: hypothetical protein ABIS50_11600 [Luteolibacter sp.]|uniref:hypothetical protein n=1 Tax=Luteolibacter sp. TaxID=1962973 RepID=UPI003266BCA2